MPTPLESLIATGTKVWLDSVDPDLVAAGRPLGVTGATSNPLIVSDLVRTGRFDDRLEKLVAERLDTEQIAWRLTDELVTSAQRVFLPVWEQTGGDDGYVSFELDPLLEDPELGPRHADRVRRYVDLGRQWSAGHQNRMIKVPASPAGLEALEELAAAGVTLNVTLIFTARQYQAARDAIWRGAQRRSDPQTLKSVYSIFISRVDVYTEKHVPELSAEAQGLVGIVGAKRIWAENQKFWADKNLPRAQEIIFASTGTKKAEDPPWKYVQALAGSDIQTNPPATNDAVQQSGRTFTRQVEQLPPQAILEEIDAKVDVAKMEDVLMAEGIQKFADPQKALLALVDQRRGAVAAN